MNKHALSQTNPHLRALNEANSKARKSLIRSLASSTAIETGEPVKDIERKLTARQATRYPVTLA